MNGFQTTIPVVVLSENINTKRILLQVLKYLMTRQGILIPDIPSLEQPVEKEIITHVCARLEAFLEKFEKDIKHDVDTLSLEDSISDILKWVLLSEMEDGQINWDRIVAYLAFVGEFTARHMKKEYSRSVFYETWKVLNRCFEIYLMDWILKNGGWKENWTRRMSFMEYIFRKCLKI